MDITEFVNKYLEIDEMLSSHFSDLNAALKTHAKHYRSFLVLDEESICILYENIYGDDDEVWIPITAVASYKDLEDYINERAASNV